MWNQNQIYLTLKVQTKPIVIKRAQRSDRVIACMPAVLIFAIFKKWVACSSSCFCRCSHYRLQEQVNEWNFWVERQHLKVSYLASKFTCEVQAFLQYSRHLQVKLLPVFCSINTPLTRWIDLQDKWLGRSRRPMDPMDYYWSSVSYEGRGNGNMTRFHCHLSPQV